MGHHVPLILRGRVIEDADLAFEGRRGGVRFTTADVRKHLAALPLQATSALRDLYRLRFDDILDYLGALRDALVLERNPWLQDALALSIDTSGLGEDILRRSYAILHRSFDPDEARALAESAIGLPFLEGWVETRRADGYSERVRAFGARTVHIVAGNTPFVTAMSFVRNIVTRSDAIFKTPSNDPLTAAAIARTMIEIAPDHPITRHSSVAYWKGGDAGIEDVLYRPRHIEKIVAWGGLASVRHVTKYVEPGIELITLDPKLSSSIIGREAFANDAAMRDAALRLAHDIGYNNQEACVNSRVAWVETGTDPAGLRTAETFARMVFDAIQAFPRAMSTPAAALDPALREELAALRYSDEFRLVAGGGTEGAMIVSQVEEPVEFAHLLMNRVGNIVPVDDLATAVRATTAYTQTVGVWPDALGDAIREDLALAGAQRIVTLGYAAGFGIPAVQDGIEPLRRMCRWILREQSTAPGRPLLVESLSQHA